MSCSCWECRRRGGLARVAPLLTAAYRADVALRPLRSQARSRLLKKERLLAHRELQLLRADRSRSARYIRERSLKVAEAQRELEDARRRAEAIA